MQYCPKPNRNEDPRLKEDQKFLLRPIVIVKNTLKLINKREINIEVKETVAQLLIDCDQV